jgi:trk system potassium uptake protein TrkA
VEAFVALSDSDEENILLSLFAKEVGNGKLITRINRTDYDNVITKLDLDTTICPKNVTSDIIARYVRAKSNTQGSNVETMYNIIQDKVEASEFVIKENSTIAGTPLKDLKFKENVLVASILRGKEVLTPHGSDVIQAGDSVVIVTTQIGIQDVRDILK